MSVLKRQRELRKAEKAARKRAKRHHVQQEGFTEPQPTIRFDDLEAEPESQEESDESGTDETHQGE